MNHDEKKRVFISSRFTVRGLRSSSSAFRAAQGCVEEAGGVGDEDARAGVVERGARNAVGGVRRGEGGVVFEDDASVALRGERKVFVAPQRDDEEGRRGASACG